MLPRYVLRKGFNSEPQMGLEFCVQHPEMVILFGVWILWAIYDDCDN